MSSLEQYRPPGRSNRSGRTNADNDVFEGLPVKQWGQSYSKVSLAPPQSETEAKKDDKWGELPMPRDYQLLNPWTQHLLKLARSGKVGTKRKQEADQDEDKPEDENAEEENSKNSNLPEERGYIAKKWKPIPEHALEPEHRHFNFLAKRRRGLPSLYAPDVANGAPVPMRKTKVQRTEANGEVAVYDVLVPEGQVLEGEIAESTELADAKPVTAAPGTVIEGVGVANDEGVVVAEHLKPNSASRRNRPPPKKKGGPGRGKKRVTFTNPDGSTYTTIVPNATKIVPQPGQTVKHVAKGEEASADISAEEAAKRAPSQTGEDGDEGDDDDDEGGDDDDDREEGELSDDDAPATGNQTPAKSESNGDSQPMEDVRPTGPAPTSQPTADINIDTVSAETVVSTGQKPEDVLPSTVPVEKPHRDASSSPEMPLAKSHSRTASLAEPPPVSLDTITSAVEPSVPVEAVEPDTAAVAQLDDAPPEAIIAEATAEVIEGEPTEPVAEAAAKVVVEETQKFEDGDEDLLGNLEKHLGADSNGQEEG